MNSNNGSMTVKSNIRLFGNTKVLVIAAILAAMSIVLGKILKISIGDSIRISFENLPILMSGIFFGPLVGAATAVVADIVGCFIAGYSINPIITLGAACIGFVSGAVYHNVLKNTTLPRIALSAFAAHILGSMIVKSIGLVTAYGTPMSTIAWRIPIYIITAIAETVIIYMLMSNKAFTAELEKVCGK